MGHTTCHHPNIIGRLTHEASRIGNICADLAINLDEPLHADLLDLISCQGILQAVPQEDDERQAFPELVGPSGGTRSLGTQQLILVAK